MGVSTQSTWDSLISLAPTFSVFSFSPPLHHGRFPQQEIQARFQRKLRRVHVRTQDRFHDPQVGKQLYTRRGGDINGDEYTLTTSSLLKTTTIKFKLGEEFEEERADGVKVKSTITLEGNKMSHVMKGEPETTIVREFNGSEMKAVLTVNSVVCTRVYKAE